MTSATEDLVRRSRQRRHQSSSVLILVHVRSAFGGTKMPAHRPRVAVGTRITPRPPHRSRRALLTHRAPPSGSGVEAVKRQRVQHLDWRKEAIDDANEALPGEVGFLAAPPERLEPEPPHLIAEPPHARVVARDRVVVQMPLQHLLQPGSGLRDGGVHTFAQLRLDHLELGLARIRFLIVLRPMTNEPHLYDRVQKWVKPKKLLHVPKVSDCARF